VGPRTSADGSSSINLNKSVDGASLPRAKYSGAHPSLIPYCHPIKEECPATPRLPQTVQFNGVPSHDQDQPKTLDSQTSSGSVATLGGMEENLSAYFEPFGAALAPLCPGTRDSIASNESDSALLVSRSVTEQQDEVQAPSSLPPIPEQEGIPVPVLKKPPPTLPNPAKKRSKAGPSPPPKTRVKKVEETTGK
jgi:hypothetical protein